VIDTAGVVFGGLVLGVAGSGHCATMCGPLVALANPRTATTRARERARHALLYHGGRLATYATLGAVIGLTGGALASAGLGRTVAWVAAGALLLQAAAAWRTRRGGFRSPVGALITRAIGRAGAWMRHHTVTGPMLFGALTGLLPCGLVYAALTAAAGVGGAADSGLFMLAFGVGTVPLLATVGLSAERISRVIPASLKRAAPIALVAVAVLLIVRASGSPATHANHVAPAATPAHNHRR